MFLFEVKLKILSTVVFQVKCNIFLYYLFSSIFILRIRGSGGHFTGLMVALLPYPSLKWGEVNLSQLLKIYWVPTQFFNPVFTLNELINYWVYLNVFLSVNILIKTRFAHSFNHWYINLYCTQPTLAFSRGKNRIFPLGVCCPPPISYSYLFNVLLAHRRSN